MPWREDSDRARASLADAIRAASATDHPRLQQLHDEVFRTLGIAFVEARMSGVEFEAEFLEFWRLYRDSGVPMSSAVDTLFTDVDVFCGDPDLWEEGDLDEEGLRDAVRRFLSKDMIVETACSVAGLKALSYADSEAGATDFAPDSYVLILADHSSIVITSATDWTLVVEPGTWPSMPNWAWPPESWRYEEVDSPVGAPGFDVIRYLADIRNEVGQIVGIEISFDRGTVRLTAGDSVAYSLASS